jgi:hypothetical protein
VLALGQAIVQELKLDNRGAVLERWLAHHLAELMTEAGSAIGPAKAAAEQQAVDVILKLWMHRRALPEPVDPLGGYRNAIEVLGRLMPEADPWKRYRQHGAYEDLLHEMFETLTRTVCNGILLTQFTRARLLDEAESRALEDEELFLEEMLDRWMPFFTRPQQSPKIVIKFVDSNDLEEEKNRNGSADVERNDLTPEQQAEQAEASFHAAILENLERMQTALASLLDRWNSARTGGPEMDEDEAGN